MVVLHALADEIGCGVQALRQREGVELLHLAGRHQDVVADAVAHEENSVAVVDYASGRIDELARHRVVGGVYLVTLVYYLHPEQLAEEDKHHHPEPDQQLGRTVVGFHTTRDAGLWI